jgi:hypothetical protein
MAAPLADRVRLGRTVALVLTGAIALVGVWEVAYLIPYIDAQHALGTDLNYYRSVGEHWLNTGSFYLPRQLAGPYVIQTDVDVLYPPIAIPWFVAFHWLPFAVWYAIPAAVVGWAMWRLRPAMWTWPIIAFLAIWPRDLSNILYGNSDIWVIAAIAAGAVLGWPAILVAVKPSLAPFILIGVRHRSWWILGLALAIASLPFLGLWFDYLRAIHDSDARWWWSLEDIPPMLLPLVAWVGRREGGVARLGDLVRWRPRMALAS